MLRAPTSCGDSWSLGGAGGQEMHARLRLAWHPGVARVEDGMAKRLRIGNAGQRQERLPVADDVDVGGSEEIGVAIADQADVVDLRQQDFFDRLSRPTSPAHQPATGARIMVNINHLPAAATAGMLATLG